MTGSVGDSLFSRAARQQGGCCDNRGARRDILGNDRIGADRRATADADTAKYLRPRANIDAVLDRARRWSSRCDLVTDDHVIDARVSMDNNPHWVGGENTVLGARRADFAAQEIHDKQATQDSGTRCRVRKMSIRAALLLLIQGFFG